MSRLAGDAAGEGVGGEVGEHGDGAGDDEAGGVLGDVDVEAGRLKQPGRLGEGRGRAPVGRGDRDGGGGGRVEDAVDDDDRALERGRQRGGGHALALGEEGAGRELDEAVGQPGGGVVAVAGHGGDAGPVEQGAQR